MGRPGRKARVCGAPVGRPLGSSPGFVGGQGPHPGRQFAECLRMQSAGPGLALARLFAGLFEGQALEVGGRDQLFFRLRERIDQAVEEVDGVLQNDAGISASPSLSATWFTLSWDWISNRETVSFSQTSCSQ